MTLSSILALLSIMSLLAAIPDAGVFVVLSRSLSAGIWCGFAVVLGMVLVDYLYIFIAIYGLLALNEIFNKWFFLVSYLGVAYLIIMGILLCKNTAKSPEILERQHHSSWLTDFFCGVAITLGDIKAVLFYMSLLPVFVDFVTVSVVDVGIIMLAATLAIIAVKLGYALVAVRVIPFFFNSSNKQKLNYFTGSIIICIGIYLALSGGKI